MREDGANVYAASQKKTNQNSPDDMLECRSKPQIPILLMSV
jgi:hypothetical protein